MTGARNITQLCCSPNLAGIVANKIEQKFLFCLFLFWNRVNRTRPKAPIWKTVYCGVIMASVAHQHVHFGHQSFVGQALDVGRSLAQTVQDLGGAGGGWLYGLFRSARDHEKRPQARGRPRSR